MSRQLQRLIEDWQDGFDVMNAYFNFNSRIQKFAQKEKDHYFREFAYFLMCINSHLICANITKRIKHIRRKVQQQTGPISLQKTARFFSQLSFQEGNMSMLRMTCSFQVHSMIMHMGFFSQQIYDWRANNYKQWSADHLKLEWRKSQMATLQTLLRDYMVRFVKEKHILSKEWTELDISLNEPSLITFDFLVSILQFNALLIEHDNDWLKFGKISQIQKHAESPVRMNKEVFDHIVEKIIYFKLHP